MRDILQRLDEDAALERAIKSLSQQGRVKMPDWTPGPWRFEEQTGPRDVRLKRRHWQFGQVHAPARGVGFAFGDDEANARLIAAAPELYEALAEVTAELAGLHFEQGIKNEPSIVRAEAALAKARGKADA
jgi:hypothetical protein